MIYVSNMISIFEQSGDINQIKIHGELMVMKIKKLIFPEIILDMDILLNIPYKLLTFSSHIH